MSNKPTTIKNSWSVSYVKNLCLTTVLIDWWAGRLTEWSIRGNGEMKTAGSRVCQGCSPSTETWKNSPENRGNFRIVAGKDLKLLHRFSCASPQLLPLYLVLLDSPRFAAQDSTHFFNWLTEVKLFSSRQLRLETVRPSPAQPQSQSHSKVSDLGCHFFRPSS